MAAMPDGHGGENAGKEGGGDGCGALVSAEQAVRPPWVRVAAAPPSHADEPAVRPRRVFAQVIAGALIVLVAVALVGVLASRRLAEAEAVNDAARITDLLADAVVQPALTDGLLSRDAAALGGDGPGRAGAPARAGDVVRVKIWTRSGRIVYSDEPAADRADASRSARTSATCSSTRRPTPRSATWTARRTSTSAARASCSRSTGRSGRRRAAAAVRDLPAVRRRSPRARGQLWRGFAGITLTQPAAAASC